MSVPAFALMIVSLLVTEQPERRVAVLPEDYGPCGRTSLYLICRLKGVEVTWDRLKEMMGPAPPDGIHSFADLAKVATQLGMHPVGLRLDRQSLGGVPLPAIVHTRAALYSRLPHMMVLVATTRDGVYVLDAPSATRLLPWPVFQRIWTGNTLVLADNQQAAARLHNRFEPPAPNRTLLSALSALGALALAVLVFVGIAHRRLVGRAPEPARDATTAPAGIGPRRRSRALIAGVGLGVAVVGLLTALKLGGVFDRSARLVLERTEVDLGELPPGERSFSLPLRNSGRQTLNISEIRSTCSCVVASEPQAVPPGGIAALQLTLNVDKGPQNAHITILSNDPRGPQTLMLRWLGAAQPILVPARLNIRRAPLNAPFDRAVHIVYPSKRSGVVPQVEKIDCDDPAVQLQVAHYDDEAIRTGLPSPLGQLALRVRVDPPSRPVVLKTDCKLDVKYGETRYNLKLPLEIEFVGPIIADASAIVFAAPTAARLVGQKRRLRLSVVERVRSISLNHCPSWLNSRVQRQSPIEATVDLEVTRPPSPISEVETILVQGDSDPAAEVRVQVHTFVAGS